ncbi:hypothetical protein GQ457_17G016860 [Hibiscus cannabinus]
MDATSAELFAILEAITLFKQSNLAPLSFKPIIEACLKECEGLLWSFEAIPRAANTTADKLAKCGIYRGLPLVWNSPNS